MKAAESTHGGHSEFLFYGGVMTTRIP